MLFQNIPEDKSKVKLYCNYDEFDMTLVSLESGDINYGSRYEIIMPRDNFTIELKTTNKEYYSVLSKIMLNYSNIQPGCYSPLYFNLETESDLFQEGIITNLEEYWNSETIINNSVEFLVAIKFNYRQEIKYCEP